jgi:hypothetical protein
LIAASAAGPGAELGVAEPVERHVDRVQMAVQVVGIGVHVQQSRQHLAARLVGGDVVHRREPVAGVVAFGELAQAQDAAVVLGHLDHLARRVHRVIASRRGMKSSRFTASLCART